VILARRIAALGGYDRALSFDMGGTTAKITLIDDYTRSSLGIRSGARVSFRQRKRDTVRIP